MEIIKKSFLKLFKSVKDVTVAVAVVVVVTAHKTPKMKAKLKSFSLTINPLHLASFRQSTKKKNCKQITTILKIYKLILLFK